MPLTAMSAVPIAGAALGAAESIAGFIQARKARKALENLDIPELNNVYQNMRVSTLGSDLQRQEQARNSMANVEALRGAGVRGLVGGLGRNTAQNQLVNSQIGAGLDQQQTAIEQMIAADNANIRAMNENRYAQDVNALSTQYNQGQKMGWGGLGAIAQSGMNGLLYKDLITKPATRDTVSGVVPSNPLY